MGRAQRGRGRRKPKPITAVVKVGSGKPRTVTITPVKSRPTPPTRVTVASPSGREGRTITVSSRSILARGRKVKDRRGRGIIPPSRPRPLPVARGTRPQFTGFVPFQESENQFKIGSDRGFRRASKQRVGQKQRPQRTVRKGLTAVSQIPFAVPRLLARGTKRIASDIGSDFDSLNVFRREQEEEDRPRRPAFIARKRRSEEVGSDFDVLNFFG